MIGSERTTRLLDSVLLVIAGLAGITFWVTLPAHPFPGSPFVKALPAVALAIYAARHRCAAGWMLPVALIAHGIGDVLLDVDRTGLFLWALRAFLVGHVLYAASFWPHRRGYHDLPGGRRVAAGLVVGNAITVFLLLWPQLVGILALAVPVYIAVISVMCVFAIVGPWKFIGVALGAISFVVSDSLIAIDKFLVDLPWAMYAVWPTYVAAQILIAKGFVAFCTERGRRAASTVSTLPA